MKIIDNEGRPSQVMEAHAKHVRASWAQVISDLRARGGKRQDIEAALGVVVNEMRKEISGE